MTNIPALGRWQKDFFKNIHIFESSGYSNEEAAAYLNQFLKLSADTPLPKAMQTFTNPELFEESGVYTEKNSEISQFMMKFLSPVMKNFTVEGTENLEIVKSLAGKYPVTLVSNHLSHLDAPSIYQLIYNASPAGKDLAERLVFIAGRLAYEPDFTRLGLYMFGTLLVCSKKDMGDNPSLSDIMTRINMRSFRQSQKLQSEGKVIAIFPEGTRSRNGKLLEFVDTVFHYVANKIILPVSIEGTDEILPTSGFQLNQATGKLKIGQPVLFGKLKNNLMNELPDGINHIKFPDNADSRQFLIDNLALFIGQNLGSHKHGIYRNLYNGDIIEPEINKIIPKPDKPDEIITIIGKSKMSIAIAAILANKNVQVNIYDPDEQYAQTSQRERRDSDFFPVYKLPPNIIFTCNPEDIKQASMLVQGANPWHIHDLYSDIFSQIRNDQPVLNIAKGFINTKSGLISDKLLEFGIKPENLSILSGALNPEQVMERKISGFEIASTLPQNNIRWINLLNTGYTFPREAIIPNDITGVQLGGALKSIYALAVGMVEGHFQKTEGGKLDNTLFHVFNRFFQEMTEIGIILGGQKETFYGLSGLSDFMQSSFGSQSTNRSVGAEIALQKENSKLTSGIYGLEIVYKLVDLNKFPIIKSAYDVAFNEKLIGKVIVEMQAALARK